MQQNIDWTQMDTLCRKLAKNCGVTDEDFHDFIQELELVLLEYDQYKLSDIIDKGHLKFWLSRVILNMYKSKTSRWYYKYKKYSTLIERAIDLTVEEHKEWSELDDEENHFQ